MVLPSEKTEVWKDFAWFLSPFFRAHALQSWPKVITYKWCQLLRSLSVHVDNGRKNSRIKAPVRLLPRIELIMTFLMETESNLEAVPEEEFVKYTLFSKAVKLKIII